MSKVNRVLCFGDVVSRPGRTLLGAKLPHLVKEYDATLVIVNGENASGGTGIDVATVRELLSFGAQVITLGDHTWRRRDLHAFLDRESEPCIRPGNYSGDAPGKGWTIAESALGTRVGVMNLIGRTFMNTPLDCPFRKADEYLAGPLAECKLVICDFHAEATSEKVALGRYLDGRISLLFGTHTHVQTADEQILPQGTGYISDLGMCGSTEGVIGLDATVAVERFLSGVPRSYKPAKGSPQLCGIVAELDTESGRTERIERIRVSAENS